MNEDKPSIFINKNIPMDICHVKGIMPFSNINQELFKEYYSPSAVSLSLLLESLEVLKGFYGDHLFKTDDAKVFFPKDTCDPILILYTIPTWEDGKWESRKVARHSMVIAIAPRARLEDEKTDQFPMLADIEIRKKSQPDTSPQVTAQEGKE